MKPYKIVFALSYEIQAEDEADARDKAESIFLEDVEENKNNLIKLFKITCEDADAKDKEKGKGFSFM
jgi:hypothetical protein